MKTIIPFISLVVTFLLCFKIIPTVIRIARLKNLVDEPNSRTSHKKAVPTLGGVGIYLSFSITTLLLSSYYYIPEFNYLLLGMMVLFFLGIKDDIVVLSANKKLIGEIAVAVMLTYLGDLRLTSLQGVFGIYEIPYGASVLLTSFIYIALINAINLIDGIDGLASGVGILTLSFLGVNFYLMGHLGWSMLCFAMVGALFAFFLYNVFGYRNKIFMGDTGSLILGLFLTATTIKFIEMNATFANHLTITFAPAVAIALLILPIFDTIRVFSVRIANGRSPFSPDKNHLHHLLLYLGFKHKVASYILISTNALFILSAYLLGGYNVNVIIALLSLAALGLIGTLVYFKTRKQLSNEIRKKNLLYPNISGKKIVEEREKLMEHIN